MARCYMIYGGSERENWDGISLLYGQQAQHRARIAVLPMHNREGSRQYSVVCAAVTHTMELTLKLMGKYTVVQVENRGAANNDDDLRQTAVDYRLDSVIFGEASTLNGGQIAFRMSVYDRQKDEVVLTGSATATDLLNVFDAADELVISLAEAFSGRHIGYGTLSINNSGESGAYSVYIDDQLIAENADEISKILIGRHRFVITQKRIFGDHTLFSGDLDILEDKKETIYLDLPYTTQLEASQFSAIDDTILSGWNDLNAAGRIKKVFEQTRALFHSAPDFRPFVELKQKYRRRQAEFTEHSRARSIQVPTAQITVDGSTADWDTIPLQSLQRSLPDGQKNVPDASQRIEFVKLAVDRSRTQLYVLMRTMSGSLNRKHSYRLRFDNRDDRKTACAL